VIESEIEFLELWFWIFIYYISHKGTATLDIKNINSILICLPTEWLHFQPVPTRFCQMNLHFQHFRSNFFMERFQSGCWLGSVHYLAQARTGFAAVQSVHTGHWALYTAGGLAVHCTYGGCAVVYSSVPKGELSTATGSRTALLYCHRKGPSFNDERRLFRWEREQNTMSIQAPTSGPCR
jgi:hypothetical protein